MQFGLYLIDRGLVTAEQFVAALREQQTAMPPLGQLAIERGLLSVRDVFRVLRVQSDFTHERFGETAVDLGLLSKEQVVALLELQSGRRPSVGEMLVRQGAINQETYERELATFRTRCEDQSRPQAVEIARAEVPKQSLAFSESV
ncbi:MAG: hypothetical protein AAGF31_05880 [Planctomycetota bacterium]